MLTEMNYTTYAHCNYSKRVPVVLNGKEASATWDCGGTDSTSIGGFDCSFWGEFYW